MPSNEFCLTLDILRHGQCKDGNAFRGSTDVALTTNGFNNMLATCKKAFANTQHTNPNGWDKIISSPLIRCADFAKHISHTNLNNNSSSNHNNNNNNNSSKSSKNTIPIEFDNAIKELHFGEWEGKDITSVWETEPKLIDLWLKNPSSVTPKNGEEFTQFYARITQFYQTLVRIIIEQQSTDQHILVVTHGGVIRCILAYILGLPFTHLNMMDVPYAGLTQIKIFVSSKGNITKIMHINGVTP